MTSPPPLDAPMIEHALYWAASSFLVIPICWPTADGQCGCGRNHTGNAIGKAPWLPKWQEQAANEPAVIRRWWQRWPLANIGGLVTERAGTFVVDGDRDTPETRAVREWAVTTTRVHQTSQPFKFHAFFRRPDGLHIPKRSTVACGVNCESNGQVLLPPSLHRNGVRYSVVSDLPIVLPPPELLPWLQSLPLDGQNKRAQAPKGKRHSAPTAAPEPGSIAADIVGGLKDCPPFDDVEHANLESALWYRDADGARVLDPSDPTFDAWSNVMYPLAWLLRNGWPESYLVPLFVRWCAEADGLKDEQGREIYPGRDECERRLRHAVEKGQGVANPKTVHTIYGLVRDRGWVPPPREAASQPGALQGDIETSGSATQPATQVAAIVTRDDFHSYLPAHEYLYIPTGAPRPASSVTLDDFYSYLPMHQYLHIPTRALWPASSVDSKIGRIRRMPASKWLDRYRSVEQMTWAPGEPLLIHDQFIAEAGWFPHQGAKVINTYRPPTITLGDASRAKLWIEHVEFVFGEYADRIILYLAHRVQRPWEKINHALVLGGFPGVGKDVMLVPVRQAVGPWNFMEASPKQVLGRFNGFLKAVILRISEARDLGEVNQFAFYDATKTMIAAPPEAHRIDEKNIKEYSIPNINGTIISSNYKHGLYLPANDRRHYVAWSALSMEDFEDAYWQKLFRWYEDGGIGHVVGYLAALDIKGFDPKAPPPKTPAFWAVARKLKKYGFELTCVSDGTLADMRAGLAAFQGTIEPGGVGLVFFAGHGIQIDGENFLFACDTEASANFSHY
jgi:hypothetical protein